MQREKKVGLTMTKNENQKENVLLAEFVKLLFSVLKILIYCV